jgi:plasmid maintenance system antidote protein VapI
MRMLLDMAKRRSMKLSDAVRKAIDDSGESRYAIAKATGIDESALGKFYNGHRGITTDTLDRLGEYLGLRIAMDRKPKSKGK